MNVAWGPSLIEQCFLCHRYTPLQRSTAVQAASEYDTAHRLHYPQSLTSKFPRHSTKPCTPELGVPRSCAAVFGHTGILLVDPVLSQLQVAVGCFGRQAVGFSVQPC